MANSSEQIACKVVPGITSLQALAASIRSALTASAKAFQITLARRLAEGGFPEGVDSVLVDARRPGHLPTACRPGHAYLLGRVYRHPDEVLIAGPLSEVAETIRIRRFELREQHGWMDSYCCKARSLTRPINAPSVLHTSNNWRMIPEALISAALFTRHALQAWLLGHL